MKKQLYRAEKEIFFAGVCGGLAECWNMNPLLLRMLWVILSCCAGLGILIYIILAIVLPKKSYVI